MVNYELTVILRNKELDALKEKVRAILAKHDVSIKNEDTWGIKKLAYEIKGENEAYYGLYNLEAPPEKVEKVIAEFRLNSDILRNFFLKIE